MLAVKWSDPYAGAIVANTTIGGTGQTLVNIYQSISVVSNTTLTIQPGTTLLFAPGTSLTVQQGSLVANGTALNPITLDSANDVNGKTPAPGDWGGVILGTGASASSLKFVQILYGGGLTLSGCAPVIDAFAAENNILCALNLQNAATLTTSSALLTGNGIGIEQSTNSFLRIQNSVIKNNGTNALAAGSSSINAVSNWWGSTSDSTIQAQFQGNITYSPFLTYEPLLTPALGSANGLTQVGSTSVDLALACRTAEAMRVSENSAFAGVFFVPFTNFLTFPLSAGGGLKHIYAQYRSITGQTNTPVELDITYITAGPVIQSFSLNEGQVLNRPLTVTGSATAVLGVADIEFYVDGVLWGTNSGGTLSQYFDVRTLANAIHPVEILARDTSGNIATLQNNVVVSLTPPVAPVVTVPSADLLIDTNVITLAGVAEPGMSIQVTRNGQIVGTTKADAQGNFGVTNASLVEGDNLLLAVAFDSTGTTPSTARHVTVETAPPAQLVMNPPVYAPGAGLNLSWHFPLLGKVASRFQLFWSTAPFAATNQATGHSIILSTMAYNLLGLANGTYYFGVVGYDEVGNPSPLSALVSTVYDATPPALSITYSQPSPVGPGSLGIILSSSKALAGAPALTIQPSGAISPILLNLTNVALNTYQTIFNVTPATPSGVALINASAQDQVGNVFNGSPLGAALTIDTTPPAGNLTTSPVSPVPTAGGTNVAVSLVLTKPAGSATPPTLVFTPPTGTSFSVSLSGAGSNWGGGLALTSGMGSGLGKFALTATDNLGNIGTNLLSGSVLEIYNTALPPAPAAPRGLAATSLPAGNVSLTWNIVSNAQIYKLYREPGTNLVPPTVLVADNITSNNLVDLPPADGFYRYGVSASRLGSESGISNVVVAMSGRTPPPAPTNVQVALAATGVQISWQEPSGGIVPDHYNLYRNGAFLARISGSLSAIDYPPRGTNTYVVAAADAIGNENPSSPAAIQLLVGPVNNLAAQVTSGQAPLLNWQSDDPTVISFNVYRNGVKQNAAALTTTNYVDSLPLADTAVYAVTALNNASQESPPRSVSVFPLQIGLLIDSAGTGTDNTPLTSYFDQFQLGIRNLSRSVGLPLAQMEFSRTVPGLNPMTLTQSVAALVPSGLGLQQALVLPQASIVGPQSFRLRAFQQTDSEGSRVVYQNTFAITNAQAPTPQIAVSVNQLPLAGGVTPFQVQLFNRGYADLQLIVSRGFGGQPGDLYMSVLNSFGQEVSRTPFMGTPPGTTFLRDGTAYVAIKAGASLAFTVPDVLVPAALAGATNTTFVAVASSIYYQLGSPTQAVSGPLTGSMVSSSLAETPYYGTAQTDKTNYSNTDPIIITGQALSRDSGLPLPNTPLNVGFGTRGYHWYHAVTTDSAGNYQYIFNPPPGFGGTLSIWAAHPLVVDQLNQVQISVFRMYPTPSSGDIQMAKNANLNFSIKLFNPGDVPLTGFTYGFQAYQLSGTNRVPITTITGTNQIPSGFVIGPNEKQTVNLQLGAAINAPDTAEVEFSFTSAEGASTTFTGNVNLLPAVPLLTVVNPAVGYLEVSLNRGDQVTGSLTLMNSGLDVLRGVTLIPPTSVSWMALNLPVAADGQIHLPDLAVGQSNTLAVIFTPPTNTTLAFYQDTITIRGTNTAATFQANVYALVTSSRTGGVQFFVDDILGQPVPNAAVRLHNEALLADPAAVYTDTNGLVTVSNLQEGTWDWQVTAAGCSGTIGTVAVTADQTVYQHTRLSRSLVTITFNVVPVPFTDQYDIQVEQTFQTHVPAGVLVVDPPFMNFSNVTSGFQVNFTANVQNYGLIQMTDLTINGAQANGLQLTPLITYVPVLLPMQSLDVPFSCSYNTPSGPGPMVQTRQGLGTDIINCIAGGIPGGTLFSPDALLGLAALFAAQERCYTDLSPQDAAAALAILASLSVAASTLAGPLEILANYLGSTLGCIVGLFIGDLFGGGGGGFPESNAAWGQAAGCFAPDTRVLMGDGTLKMISEIQTNDIVRAGPHLFNTAVVSGVFSLISSQVHEIQLVRRDGTALPPLLATGEHALWVDGKGWTAVKNLKPGDWLFNSEGQRVRVTGNRLKEGSRKVYTLSLLGDNAFYANDVLVRDLCGLPPPATPVNAIEAAK